MATGTASTKFRHSVEACLFGPLTVEHRSGEPLIRGVAMRYGSVALNGQGAKERFAPGSFRWWDVEFRVEHHTEAVARLSDGTVDVIDSAEALSVEIRSDQHKVIAGMIESGRLNGMSVEFVALDSEYDDGVRAVRAAILVGVAACRSPAFPDTSVTVRSRRETVWL